MDRDPEVRLLLRPLEAFPRDEERLVDEVDAGEDVRDRARGEAWAMGAGYPAVGSVLGSSR